MTREELIAALERADGGEQDELIRCALRFALMQGWITVATWDRAVRMCDAEAYESAALTLVPDELWRSILHAPPFGKATVSLRTGGITDPKTKEWMGHAITPAIAICIAAIRARGEAGDA
jgi:hypothetical protein